VEDYNPMKCLCIKGSSYFKIVEDDSDSTKGGRFDYLEGEIYECYVDRNGFWGDTYVVKNGSNEMGFGVRGSESLTPARYFSDYFRLVS